MSAGNFFVVLPHPAGGFTFVEAFSSTESMPAPTLSHPHFDSVAAALAAALGQRSEYGVHVHPACLIHNLEQVVQVSDQQAGEQDTASVLPTSQEHGASGQAQPCESQPCECQPRELDGSEAYATAVPPAPSWTLHRHADGPRFSQVICASCHSALQPVFEEAIDDQGLWTVLQASDALRVTLSGGYGEFLDTFDGDLSVYLCAQCAKSLLDAHPWLARLAASALNINVGHVCTDGQVYWVGESSCERDADQHGWRPPSPG